jgi:hypothetical protein
MTSLENVKARLYSFNSSVSMLAVDAVKLSLQYQIGSLFLVKGNLSCPRVTSEVTHVKFNTLSSKLLLISLELEEFFVVDSGTASATSGRASSTWKAGTAREMPEH